MQCGEMKSMMQFMAKWLLKSNNQVHEMEGEAEHRNKNLCR